MVLLDHKCGHRLPEGLRCDFRRRAQFLLQPQVGTTLMHFNALAWCTRRIAMSCSTERLGRQFTGFGWETRTIPPSGCVLQAQVHRNRTLHLGNVNVPPGHPAIEGNEDGVGRRAASGRKKGLSTTSSAPRALPGRKEPGQGVVASHGPCRGANHLAARARDWEVCTPPARSRGGPGKHGRQLWV